MFWFIRNVSETVKAWLTGWTNSPTSKTVDKTKSWVKKAMEKDPLEWTTPLVINIMEEFWIMLRWQKIDCPRWQYTFNVKFIYEYKGATPSEVILYSTDGSIKEKLVIKIPNQAQESELLNQVKSELTSLIKRHIEGKLLKETKWYKEELPWIAKKSDIYTRLVDVDLSTQKWKSLKRIEAIITSSRKSLPTLREAQKDTTETPVQWESRLRGRWVIGNEWEKDKPNTSKSPEVNESQGL